MRRGFVLLLLVLLGVFVCAAAPVRPSTMDVADIRPGMKGYGLTVLRGSEPERFDVEVINVLRNFRPDQDLILIRTKHPLLDQALVVGGMSGSPIYINDKLIGAYAYGWAFGKEPVAGVTPIRPMLTEMARPIDPAIWKALGSLPAVARAARSRSHEAHAALPHERGPFAALHAHAAQRGYPQTPRAGLLPAATPLMLSGLVPEVADLLGEQLAPFGIVTLQAGGGGDAPPSAKPPRFVDGGAIGVRLIRGDINATAIGTVTHVDGERLIAFGHPMLHAGQIALPTATAEIQHIFQSNLRSFKLGQPTATLGTLVHDRQSAIVADTSLQAPSVPVRVRVQGAQGAPRSEWNMQIASHRMLTPSLTFASVVNAASATTADRTDVVFEVKSRTWVQGRDVLEVTDYGYGPSGLSSALGGLRIFDLLNATYNNPFEDVSVERVEVDIALRFARDVVEIVDAIVGSTEVDPGSDVAIDVTLRRFGHPDEIQRVRVPIPWSAAGDKIEIALEPGNLVKLDLPIANDLDQLFDNVRAGYPATSLVASTKLATRGVKLRGHIVSELPGSALDMLQPQGEAERPTSFPAQRRLEVPLGRVVIGNAKVKLEVREEPK